MKRIFLILVIVVILVPLVLVRANTEIKEVLINFEDVLIFDLGQRGRLTENTSSHVSFYPDDGGWFSVSVLIPPEDLPTAFTVENEDQLLQACIDKMSEDFTEVEVPRKDIVRTKDIVLFHTQDVSYGEVSDYLIFSDGFHFWTPKGIVSLWFANLPANEIQNHFKESVLKSLKITGKDDNGNPTTRVVFQHEELQNLMEKEKRHFNLVKASQKYQRFFRPFINGNVQGSSYFIQDLDMTSKEWMKGERNRSIFAALGLFEAVYLDMKALDAISSTKSMYTGRKSNSVIVAFAFSDTYVILIEYDEKSKEVVVFATDHNGTPTSFLESLKKDRYISSYYENDMEIVTEMFKNFLALLNENSNETQENEPSATATKAPTQTSGVSPDFKEKMDAYESFFDEYITFMKKYENASNPLTLLVDYASFLERYSEAMEQLDEIDESSLSAADQKYYLEVLTRINQKLVKAATD